MGHGKETPRQKMIGMMYLVLTALLALNVSAEVLNAFQLIDKSLRTSTENTIATIEAKNNEFEKAKANDPKGVEKWYEMAKALSIEANSAFNAIQYYKELLVTTLEGKSKEQLVAIAKEKYGNEADIHIEELLTKKDDNNVPGQLFILENRGDSIKAKLDTYAAYLRKLVETDTSASKAGLLASINATLRTGKLKSETGQDSVPWANAHFEHLPAAGVVALMSKMQGDVRNLEAQMYNYLLSQIGKTEMRFNTIKAIVNSPSNYVLINQPYTAEVFIAAYDSTQNPDVLVGGQPIEVKNGVGIYKGNTSSIGIKPWGGVIKLKNKNTGAITEYPFKSEYQVGQASVSVSPTSMNVFYVGVPNPVEITASGVPDDKLLVSISSGSIQRKGNAWEVNVKEVGKQVTISVSAKIDNNVRPLGSKPFRVKAIPDPVAKVGTYKSGKISKGVLLVQSGVKADLENFDFNAQFTVTEFVVAAPIRGFLEEARSKGSQFTAQQKQLIQQIDAGKKVFIDEISARGPDGSTRKLGSLSFILTN